MLDWLYYSVSELLNWIHTGLRTVGFDGDSGWAWAGAIVLLTIVLRLALLPLFVRQAKAMRRMQSLAPKVQEIRAEYADDKQRQRQEIMQLYRSEGTNPLASCLPMLLQMPVFLGLVQVLHRISEAESGQSAYAIGKRLVESAQHANVLGAHISDTFLRSITAAQGHAIVVTTAAVLVSSFSTFLSVRASMLRQKDLQSAGNQPAPMARIQKAILFMAPLFGVIGLALPLGVLLYWVTSNCWNLVQQNLIHRYVTKAGANAGKSGCAEATLT